MDLSLLSVRFTPRSLGRTGLEAPLCASLSQERGERRRDGRSSLGLVVPLLEEDWMGELSWPRYPRYRREEKRRVLQTSLCQSHRREEEGGDPYYRPDMYRSWYTFPSLVHPTSSRVYPAPYRTSDNMTAAHRGRPATSGNSLGSVSSRSLGVRETSSLKRGVSVSVRGEEKSRDLLDEPERRKRKIGWTSLSPLNQGA